MQASPHRAASPKSQPFPPTAAGPLAVKAFVWTIVEQMHARGWNLLYMGRINTLPHVSHPAKCTFGKCVCAYDAIHACVCACVILCMCMFVCVCARVDAVCVHVCVRVPCCACL